ncbi:AVAST type 4 anti-phage nuclease Avs4 [Fusibacter ferrireducens]|uniref:ATPase n=1 Tax=Fusibacter ferrireducens TaxID=2785058 RepID=A0ABR9ZS96_9FIRM|nr:AVAST type 4 anti-phage nuclease Avs4 [Fusibacter ferrireducens]MBF4693327.1 hypothetical protein [Fusibacter ferrireducens]
MIKPNWDIFNAKFSDSTTSDFEWFCYLLFCKEHGIKNGIFRYLNQAAIETDLIEVDAQHIGWQAKYYSGTLSTHADELVETVEKAKRLYPSIDRLVIYTNSEWAQNKGEEPVGFKRVKEAAANNNITLEWRARSYFESEFVTATAENISRYFFTLEEGETEELKRRMSHTENLLAEIKNSIPYKESEIHIPRQEILDEIKKSSQQVVVLSGNGGVGKTAVIKDYHSGLEKDSVLLMFKATEFELSNEEHMFRSTSFDKFFDMLKETEKKIVVIDSAEKLLDLRNTNTFKVFLTRVIKDEWKIVFTSRNLYVDDLNYEFLDTYGVAPMNVHIDDVSEVELLKLSEENGFKLPKDYKLVELIRNPFYLKEFLKYHDFRDSWDYVSFKQNLWSRNVKKAKPVREQSFIKLAHLRANTGQFFLEPEGDLAILDEEFIPDGLVAYETAGYFITHDIYEEWALEKLIDKAFIRSADTAEFTKMIGDSIAVRRSFRSWLSDKLYSSPEDVSSLVDGIMKEESLEKHWKDELIVSIMLSSYSITFFESYKDSLLINDMQLLKRTGFLLRLACKEVDDRFLELDVTKIPDLFSASLVFTKPKGLGWASYIEFVYNNLDEVGCDRLLFTIPILKAWSSDIGRTTELAGKIALKIYEYCTFDSQVYLGKDTEEELISIIFNSVKENKQLLTEIVDKIIENQWWETSEPYYTFSKAMTTGKYGNIVARVIPRSVMAVVKLFWMAHEDKSSYGYYRSHSLHRSETSFGLSSGSDRYFPSSALQTPMYALLHAEPRESIDFIIKFMNVCVERYVKSGYDAGVYKIQLHLSDDEVSEQYIGNALWNMYRGNGSPVSPNLLQSVHMALEKFLLIVAEKTEQKVLEDLFIHMLRTSKSASITAVVTSLVLAYPDKLSKIALILIKTYDILKYDGGRWAGERGLRSLYSIGYGLNWKNEVYQRERIDTLEEVHRNKSLEQIIINYQFFAKEGSDEGDFYDRQKTVWDILDAYNKEIETSDTTEEFPMKELLIRRMDRRNMEPKLEEIDNQQCISLTPKLPDRLKKEVERSREESDEKMKYMALNLWAEFKHDHNEQANNYREYDENPQKALEELKSLMEDWDKEGCEDYHLLYRSVLPNVSSLLVKEYSSELSEADYALCKGLILEFAGAPVRENYTYQIGDGVEGAVKALPYLIGEEGGMDDAAIFTLMMLLLNTREIGQYKRICDFAIEAINESLWDKYPEDTKLLVLSHLKLSEAFESYVEQIRTERFDHDSWNDNSVYMRFMEHCESDFDELIVSEASSFDIQSINPSLELSASILALIPVGTSDEQLLGLVEKILEIMAEGVFRKSDANVYSDKLRLFKTYSSFILAREKSEIERFNHYFVEAFEMNEEADHLFSELLLAEDQLATHGVFWKLWWSYYDVVVNSIKDRRHYYREEALHSYLLDFRFWRSGVKEWHSLKDENVEFYWRITSDLSKNPDVLAAVAKILHSIGSGFLNEGVGWISKMIASNTEVHQKEMDSNTRFIIETILRKYVNVNRELLKINISKKTEILVILNCLIENNSEVGYLIRERLL